MKLHRIYAVILRYLFLFRHSYERLSDTFYWPTIDLVIWGITSLYFLSFAPNKDQLMTALLTGILFWLILWRAQYEIGVNLLEDLWNKNLINMFVSPLTFWEWISSFMIIGLIKALISFPFAAGVAYLLYKTNILFLGIYFVPFIVILLLTGWTIGFLTAGIILRYGTKVQTLAWTLAGLAAPFSAVYYPVSILPEWARTVSSFVPTTYVFENIRLIVFGKGPDIYKLFLGFILALVYFVVSIIYFKHSFKKVLSKGLVKVF